MTREIDRNLLQASQAGDIETVKQLLAQGADIEAKDNYYYGYSALIWAALRGHADTVQALLDQGADTEAKDTRGYTALLLATEYRRKEVMQALLVQGADIEAKDSRGWTALMCAAKNGHTDIVQALLAKGADIEAKDNDGQTALLHAAKSRNTEVVQALLDKGATIEAKDSEGDTALLWAARNRQTAIVQALLVKGADIEVKDNNGNTALLWAARNRHAATVHALLDKGATTEAKDMGGMTALMWAAKCRQIDIVKALLAKGATTEAKDSKGNTALLWAARNGHIAIVQALLEKGADIEVKDNNGNTALHCAAVRCHTEVVQALLAAGAAIAPEDILDHILKPYAIIEKLAYAQGLALTVGDVRSHVEYYLKNMENNKTLHGDDIVSIYQEIQKKANSEEYRDLAKTLDDLGKFADTIRLSDLGIDPRTAYHLYCAETIYQMEQDESEDVSILALLKAHYYYDSGHINDLIEILSNLPEKASVYIMQRTQDYLEEGIAQSLLNYNNGSLRVSREELQTRLYPKLLDKYLAYGSVLAKDTDIFERLHALHSLERSLAFQDVTGHASDASISTLVAKAFMGKNTEDEGEKNPEKCLEQALQTLANALAERDSNPSKRADHLSLVSAVVVQQLMDKLPKDSYTKAREIAEESFDCSLRADQASLQEQKSIPSSQRVEEVSVGQIDELGHHGIFAHPPLAEEDRSKNEQISKNTNTLTAQHGKTRYSKK